MSARTIGEANKAVKEVLTDQRSTSSSQSSSGKKRKYTTSFTPEIARYAAENGNGAAVKKFKATHDVGERTVRLFKR